MESAPGKPKFLLRPKNTFQSNQTLFFPLMSVDTYWKTLQRNLLQTNSSDTTSTFYEFLLFFSLFFFSSEFILLSCAVLNTRTLLLRNASVPAIWALAEIRGPNPNVPPWKQVEFSHIFPGVLERKNRSVIFCSMHQKERPPPHHSVYTLDATISAVG